MVRWKFEKALAAGQHAKAAIDRRDIKKWARTDLSRRGMRKIDGDEEMGPLARERVSNRGKLRMVGVKKKKERRAMGIVKELTRAPWRRFIPRQICDAKEKVRKSAEGKGRRLERQKRKEGRIKPQLGNTQKTRSLKKEELQEPKNASRKAGKSRENWSRGRLTRKNQKKKGLVQ